MLELLFHLDHQAMSQILLIQWIGMNYTNWTNQISQEIDKHCSENYNIIFIKEFGVTIVLHKEEFESLGMNSKPPTELYLTTWLAKYV